MRMRPALYLLPVTLSQSQIKDVLPSGNIEIVRGLRYFIVENIKMARRFLRLCVPDFPIDECEFHELNTHTDRTQIGEWLDPLRYGDSIGLMSDAGCPAVADPGADVVAIAQREGLKVIPLVGPSSILLALMGSGFNGQGFAFNGYLPIDETTRNAKISELERKAQNSGQTQIFIETPYRNNKLLMNLTERLHPLTLVCVAADLTDPDQETIITRTVGEWRKSSYDYSKRPAIFLIHVEGETSAPRRKGGHR